MNCSKFILRDNQGDIDETVSKIIQKHVKNEDLEKCIRLVSEKKNTSAVTKDVALKHWQQYSHHCIGRIKATKMKKTKMKKLWMTHKAQSFLMTPKITAKAPAKT